MFGGAVGDRDSLLSTETHVGIFLTSGFFFKCYRLLPGSAAVHPCAAWKQPRLWLSSQPGADCTGERSGISKARGGVGGFILLRAGAGSEGWLETVWSFDQGNPVEWMCVSEAGGWKVLCLPGGSICYSTRLLNRAALTFGQKRVLVLSFRQSVYPRLLGRGEKVIFSLFNFFCVFTYGWLGTHGPACNPGACHWWALFSLMGGN